MLDDLPSPTPSLPPPLSAHQSDKSKIEETIFELDEKKKEALKVTWEKVTKSVGCT